MTEDIPASGVLDGAALAKLDVPVLSILGSDGYHCDDLDAVERMLPTCRTVVLPGQNHSVLVERHPEVRRLLLAWIDEHDPAAR